MFALLLDHDDAVRARQAAMTGPDAAQLYPQVADLPELLRLPLIGVAMSALVSRPPQQTDRFVSLIDEVAKADGTYSLFEYCASRLVHTYLLDARDPVRRSRPGRASVRQVQEAALTLLAAIAAAGNSDPAAAEHAFAAGVARLMPGSAVPPFNPPPNVFALDAGWAALDSLDLPHKRPLIEALVAAVNDDGVLAVAEAELLRTACALLHCPLPAMVA